MLIKHRKSWEIPESEATDESVYWNRRQWMKATGMAIGGAVLPVGTVLAEETDPAAHLFPADRNEAFTLDRPVTEEKLATTYNNFYEFGSHKKISRRAQKLETRPWQIKIDGHVEQEMTIDIDDLFKQVQFEERLYRLRCVETWSMAVPWTGFPMRKLIELAKPTAKAGYVLMETFNDKKMARGIKSQPWYPWPYAEGLHIQEAMNDMAFLVTGVYGKTLPKQNGAPLRLAVPWKYGFKSIKSIVRFSFVEEKPKTFWNEIQPKEYGFWANVNPKVPHPRWSQAMEQMLGTNDKRPTLLFNGYEEQVAYLYKDLPDGVYLYR